MADKIMQGNIKTYHFMIMGFETFPNILKTLSNELAFYRIEKVGDIVGREIMYDIPNNTLFDAGIILSKVYENGGALFNIQKLSFLPDEIKMPDKKLILQDLDASCEPMDYSLEISSAIENSFSTPFSIDLDAIVREVVPKIDVDLKGERYVIIGGTGYRGMLEYDRMLFKEISSKKKFEREEVILRLPVGDINEKDNARILDIIDRKIKALGEHNMSRFELAQKGFSAPVEEDEEEEESEEEE